MRYAITLKKLLSLCVFLGIIGLIFYHFFLYIDVSNGCFITIRPSILEFSNLAMKKAIKTLKYASPIDYQTVCRHVKTIDPNPSCGGRGGGCFYSNRPGSISISTDYKTLAYAMNIIVHETCHQIQFEKNGVYSEYECHKAGGGLLRKIIVY